MEASLGEKESSITNGVLSFVNHTALMSVFGYSF
jgi:hypothetical protein